MIATNVPAFQAINELQIIMDPTHMDEGAGIEETLRKNNAKYHQSCRLMFNNTKLEWARKRKSNMSNTSAQDSSKVRRTSTERSSIECFLCEKVSPESDLRHAMTMQLNKRLNECAKNLNDGRLLAKLSGGDVIAQELKYHPGCLTALYNRERSLLRKVQAEKQQHESPGHKSYRNFWLI